MRDPAAPLLVQRLEPRFAGDSRRPFGELSFQFCDFLSNAGYAQVLARKSVRDWNWRLRRRMEDE